MRRYTIIILALALTTLVGSYSAIQINEQQTMETFDYVSAWAKVAEFQNKSLPESALKIVNEIYAAAQAENNAQQLVKSVIYILNLTEYKEEDSFIRNLNRLRDEAEKAQFPAKPLLHSMLAQLYWNFYLTNRYIFSQRTETVDFKNDDISTWSLEKLVDETIKNYQLSLADVEKLKEIKIEIFEEVLYAGNEKGRASRPTLFDFLAHRAVDFFMSQEPDITRPAYAFNINSAEYLNDAESFCSLNIISKDTLAYKYYGLKIFQELIAFHLKDKNVEALVDVDLKRLQFVYTYLTIPQKEQVYIKALQSLEQRTLQLPASTLVTYYIAQTWMQQGNLYNPLQSDDHKWDYKKAYDICESAINRFPDSDGAAMAYNLKQSIKYKAVSSRTEKINVTGMPFRASVTYRNFNTLYWRIIQITRQEVRDERAKWAQNYQVDAEKKFLEHFLPKTIFKKGKVELPDDKDFQAHSVEIALDALPEGEYMVLFSSDPEFGLTNNKIAYTFTTITNLSYIHRNLEDGSTEFYVLNRSTGDAVPGASIQIYFQTYNSRLNRYEIIKGDVYTTDQEGMVIVPFQKYDRESYYYQSFLAEITWKKDKIFSWDIDSYYYEYGGQISQYPISKPGTYTNTLFFLDRSIYRPGQTIYYKGLVYSTDGKNSKICPNVKETVVFYDVNSQVVAKQEVTTNEFGTFSGTFTAPTSGLMGQMRLQTENYSSSASYFSVEEYKRPKFEVRFDTVKGTYRLGETIVTTGVASAYSGAKIDGASVKYRVVRQATFPWWWWCWYGYYPSSPEMEITNGLTETDEEGKFSIDFQAIPDESVDKKSSPIFNFRVYADVTDINGETHSTQTWIPVAYKALVLSVSIGDMDLSNEEVLKQKFPITSTNLAGDFQPAKGTIKVWKLKSPDRTFRSRMWQRPDKFIYSKDEFYKLFPYDLYADEDNYYRWEKQEEVFTIDFNTSENKNFTINDLKSWVPGKYILEISGKDKFGEDVKEVAYFNVNKPNSKDVTLSELFQVLPLKANCEPGETASIQTASSERINLLYEVEFDGKIIEKKHLVLDREKQLFEVPIKEEYRGGITVHYVFIKNNRMYPNSVYINVPFTNKQLDIAFETFRDKLQPGEQEQWKLKITGKNADKIMAEMVATLYDASLDAFRSHGWYGSFYYGSYSQLSWNSINGFQMQEFKGYENLWNEYDTKYTYGPSYDNLNWFGYNLYYYYPYAGYGYYAAYEESSSDMMYMDGAAAPRTALAKCAEKKEVNRAVAAESETIANVAGVVTGRDDRQAEPPGMGGQATQPDFGDVRVRKNFNETAFFYPHLQTNEKGEIIINFTVPEALTKWRMLGFAHTRDLKSGLTTNTLVTQKDLMVVPNQPRFFRENDKMFFSAKVVSLADQVLEGEAQLEFFDALTMKPVDDLLKNTDKIRSFKIEAKQSTNIEWSIEIPEGLQAISYKIVAKSGNFSDGEEMVLPVVTNRTLVTETLPLPIRGKQTKTFTFDKLVNNTSSTLKNHRYTLEFTSNPAWYAVQALPYMMEYPYECTEQTFSRFYSNSIASHIINSNPKIKRVFDTWSTIQPDALLSNLEKNQELKSALLEETPWVLNAKDETQRKHNIALLFDLNRMANEQERALKKILEAQTGNGGFPWFKGLPEDWYISQYIVAGLGHLDVMGVKSVREDDKVWQMVNRTLGYMDERIRNDYEYLKEQARRGYIDLETYELNYMEIHYLYARSYFKDVEVNKRCQEAFNYFIKQAGKYWQQHGIYMQGMMALALHRYDYNDVTAEIIKSLRERALYSEEMGMYWKFNHGYYWYEAPIETQALMIEVFDEVANDNKTVEDLKVWLLKQKQTQDWRTTKATAEACYALLRRGSESLASDALVEVTLGDQVIDPKKLPDTQIEAGTGYFKTAWTASEITPEMGNIKVVKTDDGVAWGAVYWQYFEQLDKITAAETPLKLKKQLFLQQNTDRGPVITPVTEDTELKIGDLIKVRIELRVDRDMEYIHMKDMRAAAFEPLETISGYKYQDGLYYYQSPRDLAVNFFIGWLGKGTYVFEYPLRVSQKGDFSNGITTIQCMYAPEFTSHSEGIRVKVK